MPAGPGGPPAPSTVTTSATRSAGTGCAISSPDLPPRQGREHKVMRRVPQPYRNGELVIVIDCSALDRSARCWAGVLGYAAGAAAGGHYRSLMPESGEGIEVLLQQVVDEKH